MNILEKIFGHRHNFNMPIACEYRSFSTRRIIFECECGKRTVKEEYRRYESNIPFSLPTDSFLGNDTFDRILKGERYHRVGQLVMPGDVELTEVC